MSSAKQTQVLASGRGPISAFLPSPPDCRTMCSLFRYFLIYLPPTSQLEPRFLHLYAQEQSLKGLMYFVHKQYEKALETFAGMYRTARQLDDPVLTIHALQKMGVELMRANRNQEAINALEEARDLSFGGSKHVAAFANSYLAHIYAATGDTLRSVTAHNLSLSC